MSFFKRYGWTWNNTSNTGTSTNNNTTTTNTTYTLPSNIYTTGFPLYSSGVLTDFYDKVIYHDDNDAYLVVSNLNINKTKEIMIEKVSIENITMYAKALFVRSEKVDDALETINEMKAGAL